MRSDQLLCGVLAGVALAVSASPAVAYRGGLELEPGTGGGTPPPTVVEAAVLVDLSGTLEDVAASLADAVIAIDPSLDWAATYTSSLEAMASESPLPSLFNFNLLMNFIDNPGSGGNNCPVNLNLPPITNGPSIPTPSFGGVSVSVFTGNYYDNGPNAPTPGNLNLCGSSPAAGWGVGVRITINK